MMTTLLRDLRYAARQLASTPLFTSLAILSFGLGIGANTTLYTWARALLFDPYPTAAESSRLVSMNVTDKNQGFISTSYPDYRDIKARTTTLDGVIALRSAAVGLVLAVGAGHFMKSLLLGVSPWDPATLGVVLLVLGAASLLACLVPAWRAASTDPAKALRAE